MYISFRIEEILADLDAIVPRRTMQRSITIAKHPGLEYSQRTKTPGMHCRKTCLKGGRLAYLLHANQLWIQRENDKLRGGR
jgi:hypothetical protein